MSYAGCPDPSKAISAQFTLKMCVAAKNRKKITQKNLYFKGSGSFKVIDVDTDKKFVTVACISVPICNRFHATRYNCGKITTFGGVSVFDARLRLLEPRGLGPGLLKSTLNAKNLYAGCLGLSPAISSQFSVEMCAAFKIAKKSLKISFLEVEGRSRSSMLINLKSLSPVLVIISSMSVPICNRFHTIRAKRQKKVF